MKKKSLTPKDIMKYRQIIEKLFNENYHCLSEIKKIQDIVRRTEPLPMNILFHLFDVRKFVGKLLEELSKQFPTLHIDADGLKSKVNRIDNSFSKEISPIIDKAKSLIKERTEESRTQEGIKKEISNLINQKKINIENTINNDIINETRIVMNQILDKIELMAENNEARIPKGKKLSEQSNEEETNNTFINSSANEEKQINNIIGISQMSKDLKEIDNTSGNQQIIDAFTQLKEEFHIMKVQNQQTFNELKEENKQLKEEIKELKEAIKQQTETIKVLNAKIEGLEAYIICIKGRKATKKCLQTLIEKYLKKGKIQYQKEENYFSFICNTNDFQKEYLTKLLNLLYNRKDYFNTKAHFNGEEEDNYNCTNQKVVKDNLEKYKEDLQDLNDYKEIDNKLKAIKEFVKDFTLDEFCNLLKIDNVKKYMIGLLTSEEIKEMLKVNSNEISMTKFYKKLHP